MSEIDIEVLGGNFLSEEHLESSKKKKENKSLEIYSDELELEEVFGIARKLNHLAEDEDLGVTINAVHPR